jgi:hypothetical protein
LISLFGTLSLSASDQVYTSVYAHPSAVRVQRKGTRRTYWPFIVDLGLDRYQLIGDLSDSDHFWLMQAHLALHRWRDTDKTAGKNAVLYCGVNC